MQAVTLPYEGVAPQFATPPRHRGSTSAVVGRVTLGKDAWLGALTLLRGDGHVVEAGDDFFLDARSTLHIAHEVFPCLVGNRVTVGKNACVHACSVGSNVVIGDNCVILDGVVVADNVVFEPNSVVFPGAKIHGGHLYAGMPAKPVREIGLEEIAQRAAQLRARGDTHEKVAPRLRPAANSDLHPTVFIAATASVKGRLVAAKGASIFFSNELDAGDATITIGENTNIQDNTIIKCSGDGFRIGHDSTIGHNVMLHDCTIGDYSLIGIGSTVAKGTVVGNQVLLAAGARTEEGQVLEDGHLYIGSPARKRAPLDRMKQELIATTIWTYCHYSQVFKAAQKELLGALA
jgi:carbonic anhydrase/acetyltransferase-like protein (isoleucine patch superfamily)